MIPVEAAMRSDQVNLLLARPTVTNRVAEKGYKTIVLDSSFYLKAPDTQPSNMGMNV